MQSEWGNIGTEKMRSHWRVGRFREMVVPGNSTVYIYMLPVMPTPGPSIGQIPVVQTTGGRQLLEPSTGLSRRLVVDSSPTGPTPDRRQPVISGISMCPRGRLIMDRSLMEATTKCREERDCRSICLMT